MSKRDMSAYNGRSDAEVLLGHQKSSLGCLAKKVYGRIQQWGGGGGRGRKCKHHYCIPFYREPHHKGSLIFEKPMIFSCLCLLIVRRFRISKASHMSYSLNSLKGVI